MWLLGGIDCRIFGQEGLPLGFKVAAFYVDRGTFLNTDTFLPRYNICRRYLWRRYITNYLSLGIMKENLYLPKCQPN